MFEQHETWFARAEEIAIGQVFRGRPKGPVKPEYRLVDQLIPVFEHHTGLAVYANRGRHHSIHAIF